MSEEESNIEEEVTQEEVTEEEVIGEQETEEEDDEELEGHPNDGEEYWNNLDDLASQVCIDPVCGCLKFTVPSVAHTGYRRGSWSS